MWSILWGKNPRLSWSYCPATDHSHTGSHPRPLPQADPLAVMPNPKIKLLQRSRFAFEMVAPSEMPERVADSPQTSSRKNSGSLLASPAFYHRPPRRGPTGVRRQLGRQPVRLRGRRHSGRPRRRGRRARRSRPLPLGAEPRRLPPHPSPQPCHRPGVHDRVVHATPGHVDGQAAMPRYLNAGVQMLDE